MVLLAAGIGITPLLAMAHARAASGASFTLHYYVSRAQEAAFATEIARQLTGGICQIHCSDEGRVRASGWRRIWGSGRRHPGLLLRSARIYGPGSRYRTGGRMGGGAIAQRSVPAARPDGGVGGGGTFTITLTSTGERWPVPGTKPSPRCCRSMASRCRSPARWGSAAPA